MANVAESVLVELVRKFCGVAESEEGEQSRITILKRRTPAGDAKLVFQHVEALEREARICELAQRVQEASDLADWLATNGSVREMRKQASDRCRAFGMTLSKATDQTTLAIGMRLGSIAPKISPGAIDEAAIKEFAGVLVELAVAIQADFEKLIERAKGRNG